MYFRLMNILFKQNFDFKKYLINNLKQWMENNLKYIKHNNKK